MFTHGAQYYKFAALPATYPASGEAEKSANIDNGYYAVALPSAFANGIWMSWVSPPSDPNQYWFKGTNDYTGSAAGSNPGQYGAVLAVNAGEVLNEYYRRPVQLERGATYVLSAAIYIANSGAATRLEVQQSATGQILAKSADFGDWQSAPYNLPQQAWGPISLTFTVDSNCNANENYSVSLRNKLSSNSNNDFYVDDVKLEKVASAPSAVAMACATTKVPTIAADDDNLGTVYAGETTTTGVRVNDTITQADGTTVTTNSSNSTIRQTSTVPGLTLRSDGYIEVASTVTPGTYEVPYQICIAPETKPWPTCADAIATITVPSGTAPPRTPDLQPLPDDYTSTPVAPGGKVPSVITNDTSDGTTLTPTDIGSSVTVKLVGEDPGQFTMNPDGSITVSTTTPPGTYTLTYEICANPAQTPANCKTTTVTILVQSPIDAVNDDFTGAPTAPGGSTASVLGNDTLSGAGNPVPKVDVTVQADPNGTVPTGFKVNEDGTITVDPTVVPGNYSVPYQICAVSNKALCDSAVATITVAPPVVTTPPTILATNDDFTSAPIVPGKSTPSILGNDTLNQSGNPAPVTDVIVSSDPTSLPPTGFTINTTDGTITVGSTVPLGDYVVPYKICAQSDSSACSTAVVKIKVDASVGTSTPPSVMANPDDFTGTPVVPGQSTPSVLTNDELDGTSNPPAGAGGVDVSEDPKNPPPAGFKINTDGTITVPTTATPGTTYDVPYQICSNGVIVVCKSTVAKVTVGNSTVVTPSPTPILASNDDFSTNVTLIPGSTTPSVLTNDSLNSTSNPVPVTDVVVGDDPKSSKVSGFTVKPDGTIDIDPTVVPGNYVVPYQICEAANTNNCAAAKVTIVVSADSGGGNNGSGSGGLPGVGGGSSVQAVPSLGTWALLMLSALIGGMAMRRRRQM
ncbi:IPTL-CTERM sorting domain-containing protein [Diaphorobacter sp. HDW4B]|uniref:IPTL-CTERM sorting domain-containing protein n=1 Tax=Diaphorobacter sp. HDW4B TaxID=2714925 RepID=UPI00140A40B3|nr:IPTL-CTERM sorting domain-containing protein [Diaphorobacter sp. HDW4B]QIL71075.1 IPTL-CTERM sorting domain-containing protein [Diaphorobacter sp. HDW4B]